MLRIGCMADLQVWPVEDTADLIAAVMLLWDSAVMHDNSSVLKQCIWI